MNKTNRETLEKRFEEGEDVLDYFETGTVLTIHRLREISAVLNLSALAREADINLHTLQAKIRRETPLTAQETANLVAALKRHHLATVA
jgi:hypothetical protein